MIEIYGIEHFNRDGASAVSQVGHDLTSVRARFGACGCGEAGRGCRVVRASGWEPVDVAALVAGVRRLQDLLAEPEPEPEPAPVLCACSGSATPGAVPLCLMRVERAGDVCVGCRQVCQGRS